MNLQFLFIISFLYVSYKNISPYSTKERSLGKILKENFGKLLEDVIIVNPMAGGSIPLEPLRLVSTL